jgi:hypothetical protein
VVILSEARDAPTVGGLGSSQADSEDGRQARWSLHADSVGSAVFFLFVGGFYDYAQ